MGSDFDCLVVGSGFAGAVIAREMAEKASKKVLIIERRNHIGGGAYDFYNEEGILIHKYGPHIFHTNSRRVFEYISRFTKINQYSHEVLADVYGNLIPVPFNLNSLHMAFDGEKADRIEKKLTDFYGAGKRVTINELRSNPDEEIRALAEYIYKNIFLYYTQKQWGVTPDEIDPSVTARVPVLLSTDNRYFQDAYQGMPSDGYTPLFEKMLDHKNISVKLGTDSASLIKTGDYGIMFDEKPFDGEVIYTGAVDEFFGYRFGRLPYRTLDFVFETYDKSYFQPKGTINYTVDKPYTRITEFKRLTGQLLDGKTTIMKEYPKEYVGAENETPYYPIVGSENNRIYEKYRKLADDISNFHLLGRLAEYKYYNMDAIIERALILSDNIIH